MCCLGVYSLACGLRPDLIWDKPSLRDVARAEVTDIPDEMRWLLDTGISSCVQNSDTSGDLMKVNDHTSMDDGDREAEITELFAEHGIEVEFVD